MDHTKHQAEMTERVSDTDGSSPIEEDRMTRAAWLGCLALGIVQNAALQPIVVSSVTKQIDDRIGPETYYNWIIIGYSITTALIYPITGGLSDIFGRRAFLVAGSIVMIIGYIVALVSNNIPMMVAAMIIQGFGSGAQQLAGACIGEIVPKKHRGNAQAAMDLMILPWNVFGNLMGMSMIKRYKLGYKINFIIGILLNIFAMGTLFLWYKPERRPLPFGRTKMQELARIDWIGIFLYAAAIVLILVATSIGGVDVPYDKPAFYMLLVVGALSVIALGLWEWKGAKEPFFARSLFTGEARRVPFYFILVFISGMTMYSSMALWPQQAQGMYFTDPDKIGLSSITTGAASAIGGIIGGMLLGKWWFFEARYLLTFGCACKVVSDVLLARCTPDTLAMAIGAAFLGSFGMGIVAVACITAVQLSCSEKDLGLASLLLQSLRASGGSTALAVYSNYIQEAFKSQIVVLVVPYIQDYMPKIKDIVAFFRAMTTGQFEAAKKLEGVDPRAVDITHDRLGWVWTFAFKKVYLTSLGFAAVALFLSFFAGNVRHLMTSDIAVHMEGDPEVHHNQKEQQLQRDVETQNHAVAHGEQAIHQESVSPTAPYDEKAIEHNNTSRT